ncbi:MAG TPA: hypothetical protein VGD64_09705 [Acidisarcina sp.]
MSLSTLRTTLCLAILLATLAAATLHAQVDVLEQHNDDARTGANLREATLTPANVNPQQFGMLFKHVLDDQLYTQPLIATNIKVGGGYHDVVYVTTVNNSVYAFDANDATAAAPLWHVNFGMPANLYDFNFGCLDINGSMGIIGTPVIDAAKTTLYVVALTKVSNRTSAHTTGQTSNQSSRIVAHPPAQTEYHFEQRIHALDLATGADVSNSPATISAPGFNPLMQNQRPALMLSSGNLYIGYASHCDVSPYHGYLFSYDATTLQRRAVFNTSPGGDGASIWQSGQAPSIDAAGNIYLITGNGDWNGKTQWSESFLKLDPQLHLLDWFTPTNHFDLDKKDNDLNSSGATLIPGTHLVIGGGKEGVLYSVDTRHFGHLGDQHALQHFQATGSHLHSVVYWESAANGKLIYIWGQRDKARVYKVEGEKIDETPIMTRPDSNEGHPGAMLSVSANGKTDGILWAAIHATGDSWHESRPGILHAYAADDINHELWNSLQNPTRDDCNNYSKMSPPTIANGKVYLASFGTRNIGTGQFCVYGLLPDGPVPTAPTDVHATITGPSVTVEWSQVTAATTYTVVSKQRDNRDAPQHVAASGLTKPTYTEPAAITGPTEYKIIATNSNGSSPESAAASVTVVNVPTPRPMPMSDHPVHRKPANHQPMAH